MIIKTNSKILITGSTGLIGKQINNVFKNFQVLKPSHSELDIVDTTSVEKYFSLHRPDIVIHLAAFRDATLAETERNQKDGRVWQTNVIGTQNIALACKKYNCYLIFTSSNYIFAGFSNHPSPYTEHESAESDDGKISWYGVTKKYSEKFILETHSHSAILRISNPAFSISLETEDYVGKLYWLIKRELPLFVNQIVSLTYGSSLNKSLQSLTSQFPTGIFHISTSDSATPHLIGSKLVELLVDRNFILKESDITDYLNKHPLRYPQFGALDSHITQKRLGIRYPKIQKVLYNLANDHQKNSQKN